MLSSDQIKSVAQQVARSAEERYERHHRLDRQQLWEAVRRSCRVIEAIAELENDDLEVDALIRRSRFVISELESALESARQARVIQEWTLRGEANDS